MNLGSPVNSAINELGGCISPDGCSLYFSNSPGNVGGDIYVTTRPTRDSPWGPPARLGVLGSRGGSGNWDPSISADGLALFFDSDYVSVALWPDIWLTTRTSNDSNWGTAILLGPEVNTQDGESTPSISADGSTLYWCSGPQGNLEGWDLWQSTISPIVDFTGDGKVDIKDLLTLIEHWGQNDPLCDIGPMPWGDGKVDEKDLEVLMSYWGQEVYDPTLIAHWKLDEASGTVATDSAGTNNGTLVGNPALAAERWQDWAGLCCLMAWMTMSTTSVRLRSGSRPLQCLRLGQGRGARAGGLVSRGKVPTGCRAGAVTGALMTELRSTGRKASPRLRGRDHGWAWHRVGLSGTARIGFSTLMMSKLPRDTQTSLAGHRRVLYIGAGSNARPGHLLVRPDRRCADLRPGGEAVEHTPHLADQGWRCTGRQPFSWITPTRHARN